MTRVGKQGVACQLAGQFAQKGSATAICNGSFNLLARNHHGIHLAESHVLCIPCGLTSHKK